MPLPVFEIRFRIKGLKGTAEYFRKVESFEGWNLKIVSTVEFEDNSFNESSNYVWQCMLTNNITVALNAVRQPVTVSIDGKIMALISWQSGCIKSELNKALCIEAAKIKE